MTKALVLISLNELNFDIVKKYLTNEKLKNLKEISDNIYETECNEEYKYLEPWIQWPTIYTGKRAEEHKMFRLGDAANYNYETIFNDIENLGHSVGAVSPMNVANNLKNPSYFIPDPWTDTNSDQSNNSSLISKTISYFVKKNSEIKFNINFFLKLILIFSTHAKIKNYPLYLKMILTSHKKKWRKALFLDLLLNDIHLKLFNSKNTKFSNLFLNGVAHVQHHYLFNSQVLNSKNKNPSWYIANHQDPLEDSLIIYNKILGDYIKNKNINLMVATGLTQIPYDRVKYYYKLRNHETFFHYFEIYFDKVQELMSRDFILYFKNEYSAINAKKKIQLIKENSNKHLFGDIELKGNNLFVSLVYNQEIKNQILHVSNKKQIKLKNFVSFVAIKNGMHSGKGFFYSNSISDMFKKNNKIKINKIKECIIETFTNKTKL